MPTETSEFHAAQDGPQYLSAIAGSNDKSPLVGSPIFGFPHHWQVPAATEKVAYEAISSRNETAPLPFEYLAVPWATVIDGLRSNAGSAWEVLREIGGLPDREHQVRRVTVAQHIYADRFIELFRSCGVTDIYWAHANVRQPVVDGVRIHPFPLFPAQTPDGFDPADPHRPRKYLANFIGAYNPKVYLTDVREKIFEDADRADDLLIIKREAWHFERTVYAQQMKGVAPDAAKLEVENLHKKEYLDAIKDSTFTLCPSGSGPNSIRIGESLALASIPIILTQDLVLPGDRTLWDAACVIEEDSASGYQRALARARAMPPEELRRKQSATRELFKIAGPSGWADLIVQGMVGYV